MKTAIIYGAVLALAVAPASASASGSGSGSRGGFGNGGFNSGSAVSEADRLVRHGRSQVRKRITCRKCDYHDRLDDQTAAEVAKAVRDGRFNLKDDDRVAVLYYLRSRYGV